MIARSVLVLFLTAAALPAQNANSALEGAQRLGPPETASRISAHKKGTNYLLSIQPTALRKPFYWYSELVGVPAGATSNSLEASSTIAQFERHGNLLVIRDLNTRSHSQAPVEKELPGSDRMMRPIEFAIEAIETGPVVASFPISGENPDGSVVIDITKVFSGDIENCTARPFAALTGAQIAGVDPGRSYLDTLRISDRSLNIRTHITFLGVLPQAPAYGPQPVSVVVGHSFIFLPEKPMTPRYRDLRVGYMDTPVTLYEADTRNASLAKSLVTRFRLERKNPQAAVSDPVKPIVFYLGPGMPDRWRPYVKAGVEAWRPVFEKAGFSNAVVAVDAPTPQQDPNWHAEDVSINVIRWLPQGNVNALGAHVVDPRSGEVLSAHILLWASVIDYFARYYHSVFATVDPEAANLPLSDRKMGELLTYIVAHEVGHTIGLRHNHLASTAYTVAQLRDAKFATEHGPNTSVMAYGRFNQAAQPGDGVTRLYSRIGPYDYAAVQWGYGDFANQKALDDLAAKMDQDRSTQWGAGELPDEICRHGYDPRVLTENTGAERIESTQLGVANVLRSFARLDEATRGNENEFTAAYSVMLDTQLRYLKSVGKVVGGTMPGFGARAGGPVTTVPATEQSRAVKYLLVDGAKSLEPYRDPRVLSRIAVVGGNLIINSVQAGLVADVLSGSKLAILEEQSIVSPESYSPSQLGQDIGDAVWGDFSAAPPWRRAVQQGYVAQTARLLEGWAKASAEGPMVEAMVKAKYPAGGARVKVETGDDTTYPAWLRTYLPALMTKVAAAAATAPTASDRLHFERMAATIEKLARAAQ
jgi:hypothetical protein